jgi:hypothetical protein
MIGFENGHLTNGKENPAPRFVELKHNSKIRLGKNLKLEVSQTLENIHQIENRHSK